MDAKLDIIDDLSREPPLSTVGTRWQLSTDQVMGGVSNGSMMREVVAGRPAIRMRGDVSLENKGGFVQIAIDLMPGGKAKDASNWAGVELDIFGNNEEYNIHLRTDDLTQPWQSYRQSFRASPQWQTVQFRFQDLPHRYCPQCTSFAPHRHSRDRTRVFGGHLRWRAAVHGAIRLSVRLK